mmetsp:Transcript_65743/g.80460  ORF Transcript_65743/g.80460 Transcript_65743/m.80460 type:complete len:184 (-) Transcript_65743:92-643(-)
MPTHKNNYKHFIDAFDKKLMKYIQISKNNSNNINSLGNLNENDFKICQEYKNLKNINISKEVSDLADFLDEWVAENPKYCPLKCNCQRFVFDAYKFLLGSNYQYKWINLQKYLQSIVDKQKTKTDTEIIKNYDIHKMIKKSNVNTSMSSDTNDDNDSITNSTHNVSSNSTDKPHIKKVYTDMV